MTTTKDPPRDGAGDQHEPTAVEYFDGLPHGWASFPSCLVRTEFLAGLCERGVLTKDTLPARLHRVLTLATSDAADTEWLPEVLHVTAMLAVRDARFGHGPQADSAFLSWLTHLNRELFSSSRHASTLTFSTPEECVARLPEVWATFRRGTSVAVESTRSRGATCRLLHPRGLFAPICKESHRRALAIMLAQAGAVQPEIALGAELPGAVAGTMLTISWT